MSQDCPSVPCLEGVACVRREHQRAYRLLQLLSFLSPSVIPFRIFCPAYNDPFKNPLLDKDGYRSVFSIFLSLWEDPTQAELDEDIAVLERCSVMRVERDGVRISHDARENFHQQTDMQWQRRLCRGNVCVVSNTLHNDALCGVIDEAVLAHAEHLATHLVVLFSGTESSDSNFFELLVTFDQHVSETFSLLGQDAFDSSRCDEARLQDRLRTRCENIRSNIAAVIQITPEIQYWTQQDWL